MGKKPKKSAQKSQQKRVQKSVSKKRVIILVVLAAVIASVAGGAITWFVAMNQQPEMSDWAEIYLSHIKTVRDQDKKSSKQSNDSADDGSNDESFWTNSETKPQVSFYESENNSHTMVVNYTSIENDLSFNSVAVYSIQNEEIYLLNYENTNLYYVYDINANTYNFYLKYDGEDEDTYIDIDGYFKNPEADESEYETECSTDEKAENYCGDVFVQEDVALPSFEYSDEMTNKELAEAVADTSAEIVTEAEVREETSEKLQASASDAKKRIEQKKEAKEYFMVGDQKVRFGRYEWTQDKSMWSGQLAFTLNPDFTITRTVYDHDYDTRTTTERQITTKFEVRALQREDIATQCAALNCTDLAQKIGKPAIIVAADPSSPYSDDQYFTQAEVERIQGINSYAPGQYDLMPVYTQAAVYYRYLGK